jgi:hypothetical protein
LLASLLAGVMQAMLSLALRPSVASLITLVTLIVIVVVRRAGASR